MVHAIRTTESALGQVNYEASEKEAKSRVFRCSLFLLDDVASGGILTEINVRCNRSGCGLHPRHYEAVMEKRTTRAIPRRTPLQCVDLS